MSIAEHLIELGRMEGLEQGFEQGRIDALRYQVMIKFGAGSLDARYEGLLRSPSPEAVDRYLQRVLFADSLAAVFEDRGGSTAMSATQEFHQPGAHRRNATSIAEHLIEPGRMAGFEQDRIAMVRRIVMTKSGPEPLGARCEAFLRAVLPETIDRCRERLTGCGPGHRGVRGPSSVEHDELHARAPSAELSHRGNASSIAEHLIEQGFHQGLEQARSFNEGFKQGTIDVIRRVLIFRFGAPALVGRPDAALNAATPETIERYAQRVLFADSLDAVFED